ncbi:MAG: peptidase domain protein [Parcubacteria group bacterium]|nr:peptidase domain protein [Parcubacteria group bacterium]
MARTSPQKITTPGITFVGEKGGISEYRIDKNRLRILLARDTSVPVVGFMVTYHVGSRNEAIGYTGATHLLEHLMFKGSENFNEEKGNGPKHFLESRGAMINASTWFDRTNYYAVMPKHLLKDAVMLEADRMRTARFIEKDRADEMPIVRNEFERGENLPIEALDKQIWAIAYQAHPYHHSTIGWKSDIEGVSIERLKQFYDEFYWPDNATVTVAGDFDAEAALAIIKKEFSRYPKKAGGYPQMYTEEPIQEGERRAIVKRAGINMVGIGHKIPNAHHPDMPALLVLSTVLDNGKTSRLYRALVDTALATEASVYCYELHDPSLFITYLALTPKATHEKAEAVVRNVYTELQETNVPAPELARAKRLLRAQLAQRRDGLYQLLSTINESLATGDWSHFINMGEKVNAVTAADLRRVAKTYLTDDTSTVGYFINTSA